MPGGLQDVFNRHARYQDSMLEAFDAHLRDIVRKAQARTLARLQAKLAITDGVIDATPGNMMLLRNAGTVFAQELDAAGYQRLVSAFLGEFQGTLPFLTETLELLGTEAGRDWQVDFTQADRNLLGALQVNTAAALDGAMEATAGAAITRGLFGVAGLEFGKLVELLTEKFETSIGKARTIADTAMSTWYRTAADRAFTAIEKDVPAMELRYVYSGPDDKLTRAFCERLVESGKSYTREQIGGMSNGMLPNVWLTCGGWNCRHQWVLDTSALEDQTKRPAVAMRPAA